VSEVINDSNTDFLMLQLNSEHYIQKLQNELKIKDNVIQILSDENDLIRLQSKVYFDELVELGRIEL
jgi:hypothetical protein